jgi:hypothetical protein
MSEKRDLAIVGLLLGLIGGALILARSLGPFGHNFNNISLGSLLDSAVTIIIGVAILFGSLLLYRGRYSTGGILNLIMGVLAIVLGTDLVGAVLALISGFAGLLANETRR